MRHGDADSPAPNTPTSPKKNGQICRKKFSHRRTKFPSAGYNLGGAVEEGAGELQAKQVVSVRMVNAHGSRAQCAGRPGKPRSRRQWRAWNLKEDLRRLRQGPPHGHQRSACADIQSGGEFQEFLTFFVPAPHKYRDRQRQSSPLPTLLLGTVSNQLPLLRLAIDTD